MRLDVANAKPDTDAFDPEQAFWHQRHAVAFRIRHWLRRDDTVARDQQFEIARRRVIRQRLINLIYFQDRTVEVVAVLLVAAADRLSVVERQADLVLPESERRRRV